MNDLIKRLRAHVAHMAPHQKEREQGKLLVESLAALHGLNQVATNNADWFDCLVGELSEELGCERSAAAVIATVKKMREAAK